MATGDIDYPIHYSIEFDTVHLRMAYAPDLQFCPTLPHVPSCSCTSYGTPVSGFTASFVRAGLGLEPKPCHFVKNEMTLRSPLTYVFKVALVMGVITTGIEWFIQRYLQDVP